MISCLQRCETCNGEGWQSSKVSWFESLRKPLHCGIDPEKSGQKLLFKKLLICIIAKVQERPALISPAGNCNEKQKTQDFASRIKNWN